MTAKRDFGRKPELAYVPVNLIDVDHRYQRTLESKRSKLLIERIIKEFHWNFCGVIKLTRDPENGRYWAEDGQHRVMVAKRLGIAELPAEIVQASDMAARARIFVTANRDRVAVNGFALHHALIAAGDKAAVAIDRACRAADVQIPRYPIPANKLQARQTLGLGAVAKLVKQGEAAAVRALSTLRQAYPNLSGALRSHLILGVAALYQSRPQLQPTAVIAALKRIELDPLESKVAARVKTSGTARAVAVEFIIADALKATKQTVPPPVKPALKPILPAGKPNTVRQVSNAEAQSAVDRFIASGRVTKCPTAAVAPTEAKISAADNAQLVAHREEQEKRDNSWRGQQAQKRSRA